MLVNFRFKNYKSFYEENNLSLQATKINELSEINTFAVNKNLFNKTDNAELLKSAIIFGANASGKSNILKAFAYMCDAVSLSSVSQTSIIQKNEPFVFYEDGENNESLYEVEIIQNGNLYTYGFTVLHGKVTKEWLYKRNERTTTIFERKNNSIKITGNRELTSLINLPDTTLFLSIAENFNLNISQAIKDVLTWFDKVLIVFQGTRNKLELYLNENEKYKKQAIEILKLADIGIKDMSVVKDKIADIKNEKDFQTFKEQLDISQSYGQFKLENQNMYNLDIDTKFDVYNSSNEKVGTKDIMLFKDRGFHSAGTTRLICYLGFILAALDNGLILLMDEIDSRLHFLVTDYLIKMFNSIDKNPKNAQLICTAHNVMLMDEDLRRDQIYFTCKNQFGVSSLTSLADYNGVRKNELFSKKYLAGFYSKLPNMNR